MRYKMPGYNYILSFVIFGFLIKDITGTGVVEVRMDRFSVTPSDVTADSCCTAKTCDCSMRMRVCVFNRNESVCSDREMQESDSLGQFVIGRVEPPLQVFTEKRLDILNLRIQVRYGQKGSEGKLVCEYVIDISSVSVGRSVLESAWFPFTGITQLRGIPSASLRIQVKIYCATNYFGNLCLTFCRPVPSRYRCDVSTGRRVCLGLWLEPDCEEAHVCERIYPCLNAGTCNPGPGDTYNCTCDALYTGPNCSLVLSSKSRK
ncbi:uncharacterized protein LOC112557816 [Pomacea canaliculata]|uniref:uncharacterized protein LOC112557816 n=1 Tax=Pomacea canaliculata TaxID=400727 RepID=UPI000D72E90D|nr:uncharacterized protein LOC112557816 [Pomacea canaliculata]